ncbi:MAG TPA: acyl carrier protein [Mycobacteriales bacterium]|nr:acyl carrier protein [Mycobacteriales bacterium]
MQRSEVLAVVRSVAERLLDVAPEAVQEQTSFVDDLAVDSLALVEYAMALEDELQVRLSEDELAETRTVGQLLDLLTARVRA